MARLNGDTAGQGGVFLEEKAAENALAISDLDRRGTMREAADEMSQLCLKKQLRSEVY